jgi:hypothetical protein
MHVKIFGISNNLMHRLTKMTWFVDINFMDDSTFNKAIESGFNPEKWEEKNKNKVLIEDVWYKDIKQ